MSKIGTCPICGSDVIEKEKLFVCSTATSKKNDAGEWENEGCQYKVFKGALKKLGKDDISAEEMTEMLENGVVRVDLVSAKSGKAYQADAVADEKWGIKINFDNKE
jgi:DNA topoisomerase-3